ncbi:quinone-dependent dihydroorotate dehydrogenase [Luteibaculum oceani]|uniref:Dihydroorotate dehydrogenase (quinone) n=1 Tax=Luteibaculum oceani TaxID=1294296 RepID=A0A5C6V9I8_9FLAO|nr:quinone-dependent dihydroorotate dehydrogenase [Luteibaculum oceani]TXC82162.1 quinone-dependent dihydroorotate dehydrogenase [Luteibaculum oceani]
MYPLFKSFIFRFQPEKAHYITFDLLRIVRKLGLGFLLKVGKENRTEFIGLKFRNRVGIAAGLDKNADFIHELALLGFGHVEIGTVTPKPQDGNPKPRLFRLPEDKALINRMGFNNKGVKHAVENLKNRPKNLIIGGNIGKNKVTPNENAVDDYLICHKELYPYVDYFTINVSSPNTPGLRELQDKEPLKNILNALKTQREQYNEHKPHLLKIAPDITDGQIDDIAEIVAEGCVDGLIVSNTTIDRSGLKTPPTDVENIGAGGLSGAPVLEKSNRVLKQFRNKLPHTPIVGVGGICDKTSAQSKFEAGADMIQVYSGFIYAGPNLLKETSTL